MDNKNTKHTPGPWEVSDHADATGCCRVEASEYGHTVAQDIDPSDVALIAAAPDLLAALKAVFQHATTGCVADDTDWEMVRAAIAKAEGR